MNDDVSFFEAGEYENKLEFSVFSTKPKTIGK